MKFKKTTILFLFVVFSIAASAQQMPIFSQYWMNKFLLNPAVAGHEGYTSFNLTGRKQWAGLEGAPSTLAVSGQTRLVRQSHISRGRNVKKRRRGMSRGGKVGLGGYLFTDNVGAINKTGFQGTYSYHIDLRESQLSFGASVGGFQYRINKEELNPEFQDELIDATDQNAYIIDGNFGSYYSDKNLYAGFAVHNLFESFLKLNNRDGSTTKLERQYQLMGGYRYDIIDFVYLEPSFNFKLSENIVSQIDLNVTSYFKEDYWVGLGFRSGSPSKEIASETLAGRGSSVIVYGGARVDKYFFGYSVDLTLSSVQKHSYGSHEIMVAMKIGDNARRYRWLNRY